MVKKIHSFTWNGKVIGGRFLAAKLDISNPYLYDISNKIGSDVGEEIAEHMDNNHPFSQCNTIMFNDEEITVSALAKQLGVGNTTLNVRIKVYGPDCDITFWPGKIPYKMLPKRVRERRKYKSKVDANVGAWGDLGGRPRTRRLSKITDGGTWEKENL